MARGGKGAHCRERCSVWEAAHRRNFCPDSWRNPQVSLRIVFSFSRAPSKLLFAFLRKYVRDGDFSICSFVK